MVTEQSGGKVVVRPLSLRGRLCGDCGLRPGQHPFWCRLTKRTSLGRGIPMPPLPAQCSARAPKARELGWIV